MNMIPNECNTIKKSFIMDFNETNLLQMLMLSQKCNQSRQSLIQDKIKITLYFEMEGVTIDLLSLPLTA